MSPPRTLGHRVGVARNGTTAGAPWQRTTSLLDPHVVTKRADAWDNGEEHCDIDAPAGRRARA
jgi:hypothetical protein